MPAVRAIPSARCKAHSRSTGAPCNKWAVPGSTVCSLHGGSAPNTQDAAGRRVTLATLLARDPRSPWLVLRDVLHDADSVYLDERRPLVDGEPMDAAQWDRYVRALERAASFANTMLRSQAYDRWLATQEARVELEATSIANVLNAVTRPLVRALGLEAGDEDDLQIWVGKALAAALRNVDGARDPDDIASGVPPVPLANLASARGRLALLALPAADDAAGNGTEASAVLAGEVVAAESAPASAPWPAGIYSPTDPPPPILLDASRT